jgi:hypothetical protein
MSIPTMMNALWYTGPGSYEVKQIPVPQIGDHDLLLKGVFFVSVSAYGSLRLIAKSYSPCVW